MDVYDVTTKTTPDCLDIFCMNSPCPSGGRRDRGAVSEERAFVSSCGGSMFSPRWQWWNADERKFGHHREQRNISHFYKPELEAAGTADVTSIDKNVGVVEMAPNYLPPSNISCEMRSATFEKPVASVTDGVGGQEQAMNLRLMRRLISKRATSALTINLFPTPL
ncbi:unnamed protein product [Pleuronectes platessa]|uniref:Uncharacterized protein n=1 Tax=Pleuronectes platessa TaxID=8262 RepID=A0A9N7UKC3_PLEPL|nr:unnamed protein product [Pleuronectes platessa]